MHFPNYQALLFLMQLLHTFRMYILESPFYQLIGRFFANHNNRQNLGSQALKASVPQSSATKPLEFAVASQSHFHTTIQNFSTQARKPMIRFLGPRHPQPKFDPSSASTASASTSPNKGDSSSKNKVQRSGVVLEFYELPTRFRPKSIDEREIHIINSGGCLD